MTGPIPINQPNINPQVISGGQQAPGLDLGRLFIEAMMGARQNKLARAQEERLQREQDTELATARERDGLLRALIIEQGGGGDPNRMNMEQYKDPTSGVVGYRPAKPPPVNAGPMGALSNVVRGATGASPGSIASLVDTALPVLQLQQGFQQKADQLARIDAAVNSIKDESKRPGARAILTFSELRGNIGEREIQGLFPEYLGAESGVDPQQLNAATTLFKTGAFTWGQARRQAGMEAIEGVPDEIRFQRWNPNAGRSGVTLRPRQDQTKASAMLGVMHTAAPFMDATSLAGGTGVLASWLRGQGSYATKSISQLIGNPAVSEGEQQFLVSARNFVDSWVRVVSGAQTNEQEYQRFILSVAEFAGDAPSTRQLKRNMRQVMMQAVEDVSQGRVTSRAELFTRQQNLNWTPGQRRILEDYRGRAIQYDRARAAGQVTGDDLNTDDLEDFAAQVNAALRQNRSNDEDDQ